MANARCLCTIEGSVSSETDISIKIEDDALLVMGQNEGVCTTGMSGGYVPVEICNTTNTCFTNLSFEAEVFNQNLVTADGVPTTCLDNCWELGNGQSPMQDVECLPANDCTTLYWYISIPCNDTWTKRVDWAARFEFNIMDNDAGTIHTATMTNETQTANGLISTMEIPRNDTYHNYTSSQTIVSNDGAVGGQICMDVEYEVGMIADGEPFIGQPAGNADFDASMYNLKFARLLYASPQLDCVFPVDGGTGLPLMGADVTQMIYTNDSGQDCGGNCLSACVVKMRYCFTIKELGGTPVVPYSCFDSQGDAMHYVYEQEEEAPLVLPVELAEFSAIPDEERVLLKWMTASEENSSYFEVQRRTGSGGFIKIGKVDAAYFSSDERHYHFVDTDPAGQNYYRLKIVDLDGTYEYSPILDVQLSPKSISASVYPNPAKGSDIHFMVQSVRRESLVLQVCDLNGKTIAAIPADLEEGSNTLTLDLGNFIPGTYIYHLSSEETVTSGKFVVLEK